MNKSEINESIGLEMYKTKYISYIIILSYMAEKKNPKNVWSSELSNLNEHLRNKPTKWYAQTEV